MGLGVLACSNSLIMLHVSHPYLVSISFNTIPIAMPLFLNSQDFEICIMRGRMTNQKNAWLECCFTSSLIKTFLASGSDQRGYGLTVENCAATPAQWCVRKSVMYWGNHRRGCVSLSWDDWSLTIFSFPRLASPWLSQKQDTICNRYISEARHCLQQVPLRSKTLSATGTSQK